GLGQPRGVAHVLPAPAERQLDVGGQREQVGAGPRGGAVLQVAVEEVLVGAVVVDLLQGVGRQQRVAPREPLGHLGLQRVVVVVGAVAQVAQVGGQAEGG